MPMLGKTIQDAMNEQIKNEFYSAYQYLSMAAYCESMNLSGFAHWMRAQSQEETEHAMKFYDFILDRGGQVVLQAMEQPVVEFGSPLEVFERALEHERKVTRSEEHTSELQSRQYLVCRLLLEKKKTTTSF